MCPPKPKEPPPPTRQTADLAAEETRRGLLARRGYAQMIRTSPQGADDFGRNTIAPLATASGTRRNTGGMT
jgi:hypothetical protein